MKANETCGAVSSETSRATKRAASGTRQRLAGLLLAAAVLAAAATAALAGGAAAAGKRGFDAMTVNLYLGAGTERILALDPADPEYFTKLVGAVTGVFYEIAGSEPAVRIQAVADQIAARRPDLVAVEEASLIRNQSPGDLILGGSTPATNVVFDYLELLVDSLEARGAHYAVAVTGYEWDVEMPMLNLETGVFEDVRQTDRQAILVRTDLPHGQLRVSHPRSGNFTNAIQFPAIGLSVTRGWCSVDVFVRGEVFRYLCVHLEEETIPQLQVLQAQELLGGPVKTCLPIVLAGDFNTDPLHRDGSIAYDTFAAAGFKDAWAVVHPGDPAGGLTWGHDEFLADPTRLFDRRIDLVLFRGHGLAPVTADVVDIGLNRAQAPLWASDHAALAVGMRIQQPRQDKHDSGKGR